MKIKRKAQVKFDFIIGFFLFTVAVVYSAYSAIQIFPRYVAQSTDNDMLLEAWRSSDEFMRLTEKDGTIDVNSLKNFSYCFHYIYNNATSRGNYTYVKDILNIRNSSDIHLTFDVILFGITNTGNNSIRNGTVMLRRAAYNISIRNTSRYFNEIRTVGEWSNATVEVGLPAENYSVSKIDYDGEFVILQKRMIDCGPNVPTLAPNAVVRRYSIYNGSVAMAEITYW
ncbi:MAG: hypothetical protein ABIF85_02260 [Nanoarchaeota archaeon]|nr:hypothetical protein [Nanoarchaeota archaeon]MBU4300405.1 hypothetical protein [Nanoarchaeota archaeon]MBU4451357.1 hypothetical protein [Nanoarchaeota archaeon]MCG2723760.1 hypothetical protein [archaeon]